ncbi:putative membrane protein [Roseiarcus fermentans]|uniref:Putative membrane protein n=1 Tax=Roseiarcus fermentans TaxID=1473586 RepID=A0A366F5T5_9HYPH|nr:DUF4126 domain-containing protein [Roseiarcus fermentans]RBP09065.1 putative membrane protein [Roseiarcus fermentans]
MLVALALIAGLVAGLRTLTAPAAVSWAARLGFLHLDGTWLAFMGYAWTPWIFTALAVVELITDQLPSTPSRKVPLQFGARLVSGALCGATLGASGGAWIAGLVAGVIGAVIGTYGGAEVRARMAKAFGRDRPAALIEDAAAIALAVIVVAALP